MAAVHQPTRAYSSYEAMLADPQVDAVIVAVADQFHVPAALSALEAGRHVLVEKPLGVSASECEQLRERVHETGLVLQVGTMRRFDPAIVFARDFIRSELGELIAFKAWYCDSAYRYTMTDALQPIAVRSAHTRKPVDNPKADKPRYYLHGHGSHLVDTARFLGGDIQRVHGRLVEKAGVMTWFVACDFASGAVGHLDLTVAVRMDWHEGFQVYGSDGSVVAKTPLPWYLRASEVECFSARDRQYRRPLGEDGHFWRRQVEGFAETVLVGAAQQGADVTDGLAVMQTLEAIERSVDLGEPVDVAPTPLGT